MAEENKVVIDSNPLDDIVEIQEEDKGQDLLFVATVRHLMRPFLTVFFSLLYGLVVAFGAFLVLKGKAEWKDILIAVDSVALPIIGYHFGKSATTDKSK